MNINLKDYLEAEKYYKEVISITISPGMKSEQQEKIISIISEPIGYQNLV